MQIIIIVFFVAVSVQIIFFTAFWIAFARKRERRNFAPSVSVIVCAHDEESNLRELIPILLTQDYPDFEVIIVNDRSNDGTYDFLLEQTQQDSRVRRVEVDHLPNHANGKKFALTLGIKAARHEWILLTDADCRPEGNQWIRTMASEFGDENTFVLGYSPYLTVPGFLNTFIRFESLVTAIQYIGFALMNNPYMGVGRNLAYRKSFFLDNKGFGDLLPITGGDDDLYVNRHAKGSNTRIVVGIDSLIHSIPKKTFGSFFKQKVRHLSVGRRYKFKHRALLSLFTLTWLITWFTALPLLFVSKMNFVIAIASALVIRAIIVTITTQVAVKYLGQKFEAWPVIFLDFLYSIYYISTGVVALLTKKVQWKN